MNNTTQGIAQQFLQHLSERNLQELIRLFADQVDWYIPGDQDKAPWLGVRSSRQEIAAFYELLWRHTEPISAQVDNFLVQADRIVITGTFSTKMLQTGKTVHSLFCIQMTVQDGLIVWYRLLEDSLAVSVALTE